MYADMVIRNARMRVHIRIFATHAGCNKRWCKQL